MEILSLVGGMVAGFIVMYSIMNISGWYFNFYRYDNWKAPFNWRIFLGPSPYLNWLKKKGWWYKW